MWVARWAQSRRTPTPALDSLGAARGRSARWPDADFSRETGRKVRAVPGQLGGRRRARGPACGPAAPPGSAPGQLGAQEARAQDRWPLGVLPLPSDTASRVTGARAPLVALGPARPPAVISTSLALVSGGHSNGGPGRHGSSGWATRCCAPPPCGGVGGEARGGGGGGIPSLEPRRALRSRGGPWGLGGGLGRGGRAPLPAPLPRGCTA